MLHLIVTFEGLIAMQLDFAINLFPQECLIFCSVRKYFWINNNKNLTENWNQSLYIYSLKEQELWY